MEKLINYDGNLKIIPEKHTDPQDLINFVEALQKAQNIFQFNIMLILWHIEGFLTVSIESGYTTDEQLKKRFRNY